MVQHIEYVPFGEVFIEERNSIWNTPYLFNAKEFDEETGLYYYGARYYDPRLSLWISVDPLQEEKPWFMPYHYCSVNPINRIDEDGNSDDVVQFWKMVHMLICLKPMEVRLLSKDSLVIIDILESIVENASRNVQ